MPEHIQWPQVEREYSTHRLVMRYFHLANNANRFQSPKTRLQDQLVCLKVLNLITQDTDEDRSNKHSTTKTSRSLTAFVATHWTTQRCQLFLRDKYEVYIAFCQGTENCERLVASIMLTAAQVLVEILLYTSHAPR